MSMPTVTGSLEEGEVEDSMSGPHDGLGSVSMNASSTSASSDV